MLNYRTLVVLVAAGLVALGIGASGKTSVTERIDHATKALDTVQDPVMYEELHARALQILRERIVAKDDDQPTTLAQGLGADDLDRALLDPCRPGSKAQGPCK